MRLYAYWDSDSSTALGFIDDAGRVVPAASWSIWSEISEEDDFAGLRAVIEPLHGARGLDKAELRPAPALNPDKVICIGLNYRDHVTEGAGREVPDRPLVFSKFANAVIGDGEAIVRPEECHALDLEVELGVVIGKRARRVAEADAMDYVAGYVVVNDVSARDWQGSPPALREGERGDGQWFRPTASDTFLPIGPVFVTKDEVDPAAGLRLRSWRIPKGSTEPQPMQDGSTADMIFGIPELIAFITRHVTLEPGDVIATGT